MEILIGGQTVTMEDVFKANEFSNNFFIGRYVQKYCKHSVTEKIKKARFIV